MVTRSALISCLASVALLAFASPSFAAASKATASNASVAKSSRAQMNRAFTSKWSTYVQRVYGVSADVWSQRMAASVAAADPTNLSNAMKRDTFEGAMAELGGVGYKLSDDQAITMLAAQKGGTVTPQVLGALTSDLVYTPVAPCRILDTRNAGGPIAAGGTRSFDAVAASFTSQGGSATNCNTQLTFTALAVNVTAVTPTGAGYATIYPYLATRPTAASINYTAGAVVNNSLIVQINNPLTADDFTIYTLASADYVADVVGYFAPPVATALQCVDTATTNGTTGTNPAIETSLSAPACAAGYTRVSVDCIESDDAILVDFNTSSGSCAFIPRTNVATPISVGARCCRVPGR